MKKLAIITSHPVQYNTPLFQLLHSRGKIEVKVFYTWGEAALKDKYDPGFGKIVDWDIPLLDGYPFTFLDNTSKNMGADHFAGIINPDIGKVIKKFNPDALLVYGWAFNSHLKVMRHFKGKIPVFFRGDSTLLDNTGFIKKSIRKIFLTWVYRFVDLSFYVGKRNFDYYRKYGLRPSQLTFAPHAVDNSRFAGNNTETIQAAETLRRSLKIPAGQLVFLFAGKLESKKDPGLLLQAFKNAKFASDVHLIIVGNGMLENDLKENFKQVSNIHFLDFQNQSAMPAVYKMADIFVLPSKGPGETWGLAVNEAMASGAAVIVSDKCGCSGDLVKEGINGYIFNSGDETDLANKMMLLANNREKIAGFKMASASLVQDFTIDQFATAIEKAMEKL